MLGLELLFSRGGIFASSEAARAVIGWVLLALVIVAAAGYAALVWKMGERR